MLKQEVLLQFHYEWVYNTILVHQHPVTGLLPSFYEQGSRQTNNLNDLSHHAWVRDNVYGCLAVWGLALAYRKSVDAVNREKAYELEQSVVKLMRSLLFSMMCQSQKVEKFKQSQATCDALHAKYSSANGKVCVGDNEWGHLQIDATSLYILMLSQMTASGLQIVWSLDEVHFVQNLVFYIEVAYHTPDYGIWERGDKTNHGLPELNASSIGMAKAALESINDMDLFGASGGPKSVIHVMPDYIRRNQAILESLLPRESNSKEIDAGLLGVISYPAFSVESKAVVDITRDDIESKLKGRYGCKRFLRDGYMTPMENRNRLHYEPAELQVFDNIECEWPLFFMYLVLDGAFRSDADQVHEYAELLEDLLIDPDENYVDDCGVLPVMAFPKDVDAQTLSKTLTTHKMVPSLYYLTADKVDAENMNPHSQERVPSKRAPFMWAQSLYILAQLLVTGLVSVGEIDPLNRRHNIMYPSNVGLYDVDPLAARRLRGSFSSLSMRPNIGSQLSMGMSSTPSLARRLSFVSPAALAGHQQQYDVVVQVALLCSDVMLKEELKLQGIETETPEELYPVKVLKASELGKAYVYLGRDDKQILSGRPLRDIGILSTCKVYRSRGKVFCFTPHFLDAQKFYITLDNELVVDIIRTQLAFIRTNWKQIGRPTLTIMLTRSMFKSANWNRSNMLKLLLSLKSGFSNGVRTRLGKHSRLLNTSCIEDMTFIENTRFTFSAPQYEGSASDFLKMDKARERTNSLERTASRGSEAPTAASNHYRHINKRNSWSEPRRTLCTNHTYEGSGSDSSEKPSEGDLISRNSVQLRREDYSAMPVASLCDHLRRSVALEEQLEILRILLRSHGMQFDTGLAGYDAIISEEGNTQQQHATVRDLLEEVYRKAGEFQLWSIVRHTAGMLSKQADALAESVTDLLVQQKQISLGVPSTWGAQRETIISVPKPPAEIQSLIEMVSAGDPAVCVLTQEFLVYLAMFIRSEPSLFNEMLRVRVGLIIRVMMSELARNLDCSENMAYEYLLRRSPFELKSLLHHMLSGKEFNVNEEGKMFKNEEDIAMAIGQEKGTHTLNMLGLKQDVHAMDSKDSNSNDKNISTSRGQWIRRRQLDGALNRVPVKFFNRVWHVLKKCHGFVVSNHLLPHRPTVQEMTAGELKFALRVESMLNCIVSAEYRQLTVEVLMLLSFIMEDNPTWSVNHVVDLDAIVAHAVSLFDEDLCAYDFNHDDELSSPSAKLFDREDGSGSGFALNNSKPGGRENGDGDWRLALFYDNAPSGRHGTMTYLAKAIFQLLPFPSPDSCRVA
eukprot:CFRG6128T1